VRGERSEVRGTNSDWGTSQGTSFCRHGNTCGCRTGREVGHSLRRDSGGSRRAREIARRREGDGLFLRVGSALSRVPGVPLAMAAGGEGAVRQACSAKYQEEQTGQQEEPRTSEHGLLYTPMHMITSA